MDLRNMRRLLAVRRYGSFAKAASALSISQPNLSVSMSRLEDELGLTLFDRTARGSELTSVGQLIADRADKVLAEVDRIKHDAALMAGGITGEVRIGIGSALAKEFMPKLFPRLAEKYPSLAINITVLDRDRLLPLVLARKLDLVICGLGLDVEAEELVVRKVLTAEVVAVAHPDHPLVSEKDVSIERFTQFPGAGADLNEHSNAVLLDCGEDAGAMSQYKSNDYNVLISLAIAGHATLIAPAFIVQAELKNNLLKLIELDWKQTFTFAAIATRAAAYSPVITQIITMVSELGAELNRQFADILGDQ